MNWLEALRLESTKEADLASEVFEGAEALDAELCEEFNQRVAKAYVMAETAFRISCALAKRTGDVDETAQIWREMTGLCDDVINSLKWVAHRFPEYKFSPFDQLLDLRSATKRRLDFHDDTGTPLAPFVLEDYYPNCATAAFKDAVETMQPKPCNGF